MEVEIIALRRGDKAGIFTITHGGHRFRTHGLDTNSKTKAQAAASKILSRHPDWDVRIFTGYAPAPWQDPNASI